MVLPLEIIQAIKKYAKEPTEENKQMTQQKVKQFEGKLPCPKCEQKHVWKHSTKKYSDGTKAQEYECPKCHARYTWKTYLKCERHKMYPKCPICRTNEHIARRGHLYDYPRNKRWQRYICDICGKVIYGKAEVFKKTKVSAEK